MFHVKKHKQLNIFDPWGHLGPRDENFSTSRGRGCFSKKYCQSCR